jgi:protein farnesyltransferase/geranylgeranyltransferase type-1 subunit alpha
VSCLTRPLTTLTHVKPQAWAHRQWFLRKYKQWDGELDFIDELLRLDVRNNSAWNHRWYVVTTSTSGSLKPQWDAEAAFAMRMAEAALHNECPYHYLRGIARTYSATGLSAFPQMGAWALKQASAVKHPPCVPLAGFLVDAFEAAQRKDEAAALCVRLAEEDVVRKGYWMTRMNLLVG